MSLRQACHLFRDFILQLRLEVCYFSRGNSSALDPVHGKKDCFVIRLQLAAINQRDCNLSSAEITQRTVKSQRMIDPGYCEVVLRR
jgi:hypothetical protein